VPNYAKLEEAYNRACGLTHTMLTREGLGFYNTTGDGDLMAILASDYREVNSYLADLEANAEREDDGELDDNDEFGCKRDQALMIMGVIRKAAMSVVARKLVGAGYRRGNEDALGQLHLSVRKLLQEFMSKEQAGHFISFVDLFVSGPLRDYSNRTCQKTFQAIVMEAYDASLTSRTWRFESLLTPEDRLAIANAR